MNRRTFLLAVGATACGGAVADKPTRRPSPPSPPDAANDDHGYYDLSYQSSQLGPNPLAFRGEVLVQSAGTELRKWNATTMKRVETWTLAQRHFCFLQDGALVAFAFPPDSHHSALYRIGASGNLETLQGPIFRVAGTTVVLPGRTPDEIYVTEVDNIDRLLLAGDHLDEASGMKHPAPHAANRDQLFGRGDGRVVAPDREGGLRVLEPNKPSQRYAMPDREALHLAAARDERLWYSYAATAKRWNATALVLARVDTPMSAEHLVDFAPGRITHLASGGAAVAALVFTMRALDDVRWTVVVIDESGRERWRADVPAAFNPGGATLNQSFVAISEQRVVLCRPDATLLAWDAAGKPITE